MMSVVDSFSISLLLYTSLLLPIFLSFPHPTVAAGSGGNGSVAGPVPVSDGPTVGKDERWPLVSSEFGEVSAVKISDGRNGSYYLHFVTMNPGSLFLPVYLYSEMLLYVNSGTATMSWINVEKDGDNLQQAMLQKGDIYKLSPETIFYLQNNVQSYGYQPQKLQIYAIFPGSEVNLQKEELSGAYISLHDLVLGFDDQVLLSTLGVPKKVIEDLHGAERQPLIVEGQTQQKAFTGGHGFWGMRALLGINLDKNMFTVNNNKKAYNIYNKDRDIDTFFGWSATVTREDGGVLQHTDLSVFMVNLTKGSMMGPHWSPKTDEIGIVVQGRGMIQLVCPAITNETKCKNSRLKVEEGDVFVVPRNHLVAQISFNNDSFVFMGFKLEAKREIPKYLAGKLSILNMLDVTVLEKSFNVTSTTINWILSAKRPQAIVKCTSCAEEEEAAMESEEGEQEEEEEGGGAEPPQAGGGEPPRAGGAGGKEDEGESPEEGGSNILKIHLKYEFIKNYLYGLVLYKL